jgi:hypothetical protein
MSNVVLVFRFGGISTAQDLRSVSDIVACHDASERRTSSIDSGEIKGPVVHVLYTPVHSESDTYRKDVNLLDLGINDTMISLLFVTPLSGQ